MEEEKKLVLKHSGKDVEFCRETFRPLRWGFISLRRFSETDEAPERAKRFSTKQPFPHLCLDVSGNTQKGKVAVLLVTPVRAKMSGRLSFLVFT